MYADLIPRTNCVNRCAGVRVQSCKSSSIHAYRLHFVSATAAANHRHRGGHPLGPRVAFTGVADLGAFVRYVIGAGCIRELG